MRTIIICSLIALQFLFVGCEDSNETDIASSDSTTVDSTTVDFETPDWTEATHGKNADADYATVFPDDKVNTLEIVMTSTDWSNIQSNMKSLYGYSFGSNGGMGGGQGGGFPDEEPDYIAVSLKANGIEWYKVGFRLKGNSTLSSSWRNGIYKLPFRLNFDKYEDDYPQIENQRFYGFKELSMSPGANDNSLIREKAGAEIFRKAGIPASQAAFYKVYIDFGQGLKYCGVYTMVEVVDDTMIEDQFGNDNGNIYKPESSFQSFVTSEFEKKNNEDAADYTDVEAAINALNSNLRTSNREQWRANLEAAFNVDHFLKWLAVNTTMLNWDTYGAMAHNYYLYHDEEDGLTWIPWDNNDSMSNRGNTSISPSLSGISSSWPLIRYLIDDEVYEEKYKAYMRDFNNNVFIAAEMNSLFDRYHELISPYVIGPEETESGKYTQLSSTASFSSELSTLKNHVISQNTAVNAYLK